MDVVSGGFKTFSVSIVPALSQLKQGRGNSTYKSNPSPDGHSSKTDRILDEICYIQRQKLK